MREQHAGWLARVLAVITVLAWHPAAALDTVKIGTAGTSVAWTPIAGGQQAGIWAANGIEVQQVALPGDAPVQQALTAGAVDFGFGSGPGMAYRSKGVPAIAVASIAGPPSDFVLVVAPGGPVKTISDLKGRPIGVTSSGSLTDWLVRELARQQGWGRDGINALPLGADRTRLAAMKSGDIDGFVITLAMANTYAGQGATRTLLDFGDIVTDFHTHVVFAPDSVVKTNPDLVGRFLKAWFQSVIYMKQHREAGIAIAAKTLGTTPEAVAKGYDVDMSMLSEDGAFNPKAIAVISRSLVDLGLLDHAPDAKDMYTTQFVPVVTK
jgi:NitT/TauT family transport system substrate-binding protein